jgi:hypothetical protein
MMTMVQGEAEMQPDSLRLRQAFVSYTLHPLPTTSRFRSNTVHDGAPIDECHAVSREENNIP